YFNVFHNNSFVFTSAADRRHSLILKSSISCFRYPFFIDRKHTGQGTVYQRNGNVQQYTSETRFPAKNKKYCQRHKKKYRAPDQSSQKAMLSGFYHQVNADEYTYAFYDLIYKLHNQVARGGKSAYHCKYQNKYR